MSTLGLPSNELLIHVVNVDHGDAIILELPPYGENTAELARFGIVDTGRSEKKYRDRVSSYLASLCRLRGVTADSYSIDFICITHPHEDHYGGLQSLLGKFERVGQFWDCGFRTNARNYNKVLKKIAEGDNITYDRIAAGFECELGKVRVHALAPSLDLRNSFDTYGVDRNNASVVLKIQFGRSIAILGGDAFLESWGKILEEFPRRSTITYAKDADATRSGGVNQLNCQLLKASHHGSKNGTSLEYLEKMSPGYVMATCAPEAFYAEHEPGWGTEWPHPLFKRIVEETRSKPRLLTSAEHGNVIFRMKMGGHPLIGWQSFTTLPGNTSFETDLETALTGGWKDRSAE